MWMWHMGSFEGIHNLCTYCTNIADIRTWMLFPISGACNNDQGQGEKGNVVLWRYINERREGGKSDWAPCVWASCPVCSALPLHSIIAVDWSRQTTREKRIIDKDLQYPNIKDLYRKVHWAAYRVQIYLSSASKTS